MNSNIYDLLKDKYSELYSLGNEMNMHVFTSPHSVIVKSRVFIEKLSKEIAILEDLEELNGINLADRLSALRRNEIIDKDINDYFYEVRKIGNQAAHEDVEDELVLALKVHKSIYKISGWFIETYIDYKFKTPIYKNPKPNTTINNEKENTNILMKLMEKMESVIYHGIHKDNKEDEKALELEEESDVNDIKDDNFTIEIKSDCLIEELSKLKESSKEAVEGLNEFTLFKTYMHINRSAQRELEEIIIESNKYYNSQLILVCGSVGDGKSHIISYFKNKYPEIMNNFTLYNDATESLEPDKTAMDTLNNLLDGFSDEKIESSSEKVILAINLGTLNNFIDSKYGDRFNVLKDFVNEKKILERTIVDNKFDNNSSIQFINFSDYSLFTLKDEKVESDYIKSLMKKITDKSEYNVFYQSYKTSCTNCKNKDKCPIKLNYELISEEKVQNAIIQLLVESIIKNKIIISTRALLNFMYDILIARTYIDIHSPMFKNQIERLKVDDYINSLTPNIIFNHKELSFIFKSLNTLDPLNIRNREVDDFIIKFNNSTNVMDFFDEYIDYSKGYISKLSNINFEDKVEKKIKTQLLKLFIRSYYLCGRGNIFKLNDEVYDDFIKYIYYWNKGEKAKLKDLYEKVKDGIVKWNGEADKEQINIFIGQNQLKYKISEDLKIKANTDNLPQNKDNKLEKFLTTVEIKYKENTTEETCAIELDFPLYELLIRVGNGYRPNKKDKNHFIKFIEFMNRVEMLGSQKKQLAFTEKNRDKNKKFRLEYDDEFEIYRFMEI